MPSIKSGTIAPIADKIAKDMLCVNVKTAENVIILCDSHVIDIYAVQSNHIYKEVFMMKYSCNIATILQEYCRNIAGLLQDYFGQDFWAKKKPAQGGLFYNNASIRYASLQYGHSGCS